MRDVKVLIELINSADSINITDYLCECADVFESVAMRKNNLEFHLINKLKKSLKDFINESSSNEYISTAVWAVGKLSDKDEKEYFMRLLRRFVNDNPAGLYQTMVALSRIGENVFCEKMGSIFESERNQSLALKFLENSGGVEY